MRTPTTNRRFFSAANLSLKVPTSWRELTDKQLLYFAFLSATYQPELAKSMFLIRLLNFQVVKSLGGGRWLCRYKGRDIYLASSELSLALDQLRFLDNQMAVRPERLHGFKAVHPLLQEGFSFFDYLRTDTFFQVYLKTEREQNLVRMANYLYRTEGGQYATFETLTTTEQAVVLLWWVGVKAELARAFPKYFGPAPAAYDEPENLQQALMEQTDAQIRALTGGDVTKEDEVLQMPCWRCFAELNAKAREAEELKKLSKK